VDGGGGGGGGDYDYDYGYGRDDCHWRCNGSGWVVEDIQGAKAPEASQ
jgi:hypothetical protein